MAGNQRVYKQRIRSTQTLQKVFRAMELIASSRIGAARRNAQEASPYDHALSQAVAAVGTYSHLEHPITRERTDTNRVAVLVVTSDSEALLRMAKYQVVKYNACRQCLKCEALCRFNAITINNGGYHIDPAKCTHCHQCVTDKYLEGGCLMRKYLRVQEG